MLKNLNNIPDADQNKLLPKQSENLLADPVNSAGLITFEATSPVPSTLMPNASAVDNQSASAENPPKQLQTTIRMMI